MNFVRNKQKTVDNMDPPWSTVTIKKLLKDKSTLCKQYTKNSRKKGDWETFKYDYEFDCKNF